MKARILTILGLLAVIVALPIVLRQQTATVRANKAQDTLVILTPHNESIRNEFGEAFAKWWKEKTGRTMHVDWRTPGGTSEIRMVLDAGFKAAEETQREGIGVDIFFGGGEPDFSGQEKKGRFVPLAIFQTQPKLFSAVDGIPGIFTGERYYSENRNWVATCVSQFGICYNPDFLDRLKLPAPTSWDDLGNPGYVGTLALADPTKSGSVARTFELIIQSKMQRANNSDDGWSAGLQLIQRMAGNARYFTDSASKIPLDVAQGNAAAGMCIDFYGRSYSSELSTATGKPRIVWIAPVGGTTLSGDPIAVLKGAPHPKIAQQFVDFVLTRETQQLWFGKPGTPNGPKSRALHRSPVRRDVYTPENLANSTLPGISPFADDANFTYQPALTAGAFNTLRTLIKAMCIDSHEEMKSAWRVIAEAGMPEEAVKVFNDTSIISYADFGHGNAKLDSKDPLEAAREATRIGNWFRANYRQAEAIAKAQRK